MDLEGRLSKLEMLVKAILKAEGGPIHKLIDRVHRQFRNPEKIFEILKMLGEGKSTKEIGEILGQSDRSIRDRLFKLNEISLEIVGLPVTEGKKGKGHQLTEIGEMLIETKFKSIKKINIGKPLTVFIGEEIEGQHSEPST